MHNPEKVNDIKCRIFPEGDPKKLKKFFKQVENKECGRAFDFSKIVPYPDFIFMGPITADVLQRYGRRNWYDFNKTHWGTYYNAYDTERTGNMIEFMVGWRPPFKLFMAMAEKFPDLKFNIKWASREDGGPCGEMTVSANDECTKAPYAVGSEEYNTLRGEMFRW